MELTWTGWQDDGLKASPYVDWFRLLAGPGRDGAFRVLPLPVPDEGLFLPDAEMVVKASSDVVPLPPASVRPDDIGAPAVFPAPCCRALSADAVIVAVIDSGIPLSHSRFRRADGSTRIAASWTMAARWQGQAHLRFGRGLDQTDIDRLAAGHADADAFALAAGLADMDPLDGDRTLLRRVSHGAHVADLAAGFAPGTAPDNLVPLMVNLPPDNGMGAAGQNLEFFAIHAVDWVLRTAQALWRRDHPRRPGGFRVVINLSYGLLAGPRDGRMVIERYLDFVAAGMDGRLTVMLPAGNDNLAMGVARVISGQGIGWRIPADDRTPAFVEVWPDPGPVPVVQVAPPGGATNEVGEGAPGRPGQHSDLLDPQGNILARVRCRALGGGLPPLPTPGERPGYLIALRPTATWMGQPAAPAAPAGGWRLTVRGNAATLSVQSDQAVGAARGDGQQSWFEDADYLRFDNAGRPLATDPAGTRARVRRAGTLNAIAHGPGVTVIGGIRASDGRAAAYSALSGPGGPVVATDISDDGPALSGVLAAGTSSAGAVAMAGTSMACARAARGAALALIGPRPAMAGSDRLPRRQW